MRGHSIGRAAPLFQGERPLTLRPRGRYAPHPMLQQVLQAVSIGLAQGASYALIALGYTMVYGVLGMINFAHGEVFTLGAYAGILASGAKKYMSF